jgi:hypothetical protein
VPALAKLRQISSDALSSVARRSQSIAQTCHRKITAVWNVVQPEMRSTSLVLYWLFFAFAAISSVYRLFIPSTVWALTLLAVPSFAVILRDRLSEKQKAAWAVMSLMLIVDVHFGLRKDEAEQQKAGAAMVKSFQNIGKGLTDATDKLGEISTTEHQTLRTTVSGLRDVLGTETGGGSFCYLDVDPVIPENNAVDHAAEMVVVRVGKYPLHTVNMTVDDEVKYSEVSGAEFAAIRGHVPTSNEVRAIMEQAEGASTLRQPVPDFTAPAKSIGVYYLTGGDHESFSIVFSAFNGSWLERLDLRHVGPDKWAKAMWLEAPGNPYYVKIDKNFPHKANGEPDVSWPRLAKNGAPAWEKPKN